MSSIGTSNPSKGNDSIYNNMSWRNSSLSSNAKEFSPSNGSSSSSSPTGTLPTNSNRGSAKAVPATIKAASVALEGKMSALSIHPPQKSIVINKSQDEEDEKKAPTLSREALKVVIKAHQDDIHCLLKLANNTFISGSKDNCLRQWSFDGKLIRNITTVDKIDYQRWITALSTLGDLFWLSGSRDGTVNLWNLEGKLTQQLKSPPKETNKDPKCKERNVGRFNCIADLSLISGGELNFCLGRPKGFTMHSLKSEQPIGNCTTSTNDWVYCVQPLTNDSLLVVTGAKMELIKKVGNTFNQWQATLLIKEDPPFNKQSTEQRPYISAITPLKSMQKDHYFGIAVFDGSVRVFDINAQKFVMNAKEHLNQSNPKSNRVWTIENVGNSCFASCGDDGFVKLWDIRQSFKPFDAFKDNEKEKSRVSVLLSVQDHQLISGSCPDDVRRSHNKAQFTFWDLRKI